MNSLKKILFCMVFCPLVSGCSTFWDDLSSQEEHTQPPEQVAMDYPAMAREMSGGSVEVYSLEEPSPPAEILSGSRSQAVRQGQVSDADPNVTVFPFDDEAGLSTRPVQPTLMPPSQYRPLRSPFDGAIQTPVSPSEPIAVEPMEKAEDVSRIYFKHGSAKLGAIDKQVIDHVAQVSSGLITVDGHASERAEITDPVERQIVNLKMSMNRALATSSALIRDGVPIERIVTRAFGSGQPAVPIPGTEQETASRRVVIHNTGGWEPSISSLQPPRLSSPAEPLPVPMTGDWE